VAEFGLGPICEFAITDLGCIIFWKVGYINGPGGLRTPLFHGHKGVTEQVEKAIEPRFYKITVEWRQEHVGGNC
jgi:hypothetical protein